MANSDHLLLSSYNNNLGFLHQFCFFSISFAGSNSCMNNFFFLKSYLSDCLTSAFFTACNLAKEGSPSSLWVPEKTWWCLRPEYSTQTWMEALPHTKCLWMPSHPFQESGAFFITKIILLSFIREEKPQAMTDCHYIGYLYDKRNQKVNKEK